MTSFRGANVKWCDVGGVICHLGSILEVGGWGWVHTCMQVTAPPPPLPAPGRLCHYCTSKTVLVNMFLWNRGHTTHCIDRETYYVEESDHSLLSYPRGLISSWPSCCWRCHWSLSSMTPVLTPPGYLTWLVAVSCPVPSPSCSEAGSLCRGCHPCSPTHRNWCWHENGCMLLCNPTL